LIGREPRFQHVDVISHDRRDTLAISNGLGGLNAPKMCQVGHAHQRRQFRWPRVETEKLRQPTQRYRLTVQPNSQENVKL